MKRILLIIALGLVFIPSAQAAPSIGNILIEPSVPWTGNPVTITVTCTDTETIENVTVDISSSTIILPQLLFTFIDPDYALSVDGFYLAANDTYTAVIVCTNSLGENATVETQFVVSQLNGVITDHSPEDPFVGDDFTLWFELLKDGSPVTQGSIGFLAEINGAETTIEQTPFYQVGKGWKLLINSPPAGTHTIDITASFEGEEVTDSLVLPVQESVRFSLLSSSPSLLSHGTLILTLEAEERGDPLPVTAGNLDIEINEVDLGIDDIAQEGNQFTITLEQPAFVPGEYPLDITLTLDQTYTINDEVVYGVPIEGQILDRAGSGVDVTLQFVANDTGSISTFGTGSDGEYEGLLPPGTYDVTLTQGKTEITLTNVPIDEYDDPIVFYPYHDVPLVGMAVAAFYIFETSLEFDDASLTFTYSDGDIPDESALLIFHCPLWNAGASSCSNEWVTRFPSIDIVKNTVSFSVDTFSGFVIGTGKSLDIDFTFGKSSYYLGETVDITGLLVDETNKAVSGATIDLVIEGEGISATTTSGEGGVFSFDLSSPEKEGAFTVTLTPQLSPFATHSLSKTFTLAKSKGVFLLIPETIRLDQGQERGYDFSVTNTGQADLEDLGISITGIPEEYYEIITTTIEGIPPSEERKAEIFFDIPEDAELRTYSGRFIVAGDDVETKGIFALTILEKTPDAEVLPAPEFTVPTFSLPTFTLPTAQVISSVTPALGYVIGGLVFVFIVLGFMKRRKTKDVQRVEVTNMLRDIKREIDREEND